jgi:hypothetical protein
MNLAVFKSIDWTLKGKASRSVKERKMGDKIVRFPIEPFYPILSKLETRAIAVLPLISNSRYWWKNGGEIAFCSKFFNLYHHSLAGNKVISNHVLKANYVNLLLVPETLANPYLIYFPQKYFDEVEVRVWTYRGKTTDDIKESLLRIEEAVNEPR